MFFSIIQAGWTNHNLTLPKQTKRDAVTKDSASLYPASFRTCSLLLSEKPFPYRLQDKSIDLSYNISLILYGKPYPAILSMNGSDGKASGPSTPLPFHKPCSSSSIAMTALNAVCETTA